MKQTLLLTLAFFCTCALSAQGTDYRNVQPFEGEAGIGMIIDAERGYGSVPGPLIFIEGRHNFRNSAFDIGLQLSFGAWHQRRLWADAPTPYVRERLKPLSLIAYVDYNFLRRERLSLFVGAGPGLTYLVGENWPSHRFLTLSPRVGAELNHRFRFTFDYRMIGSENQIFNISAGYVFGGRPK